MAENWDTFRIEFDDEGHLTQRGREEWREPVCPKCDQPIRYVLDMGSWVRIPGGFALAHARCAWTPEAFTQPHHTGVRQPSL